MKLVIILKNQPIGLLDSGLGGLSVVKKVVELMPNENIVFVADQARLPYGDRPTEEIIEYTWQMVHFLLSKNVKAIVFACNTATAAALDLIAPELDIPVIGVIQSGSLAATWATKNKHIGVIGTNSTMRSHAYQREIMQRESAAEVFELGTPKLVPLIESDDLILPTNQIIIDSLQPFSDSDIDTLILGCTHYPLIKDTIQEVIGDHVTIVSSSEETARETSTILDVHDLLYKGNKSPHHEFYMTGDLEMFTGISKRIFQDSVDLHYDIVDLENLLHYPF